MRAGRLTWRGADALEDLAAHGARVAYLGHLDGVKPALTTLENLRLWADRRAAAAALEGAALAPLADLPARMLSAGQRRRLSLARLIAVRRPLWLLDEPTAALDAAGQGLFAGLMRDHLARGGIIVAATHGPLGIEAQELRIGGAA